jgi:hypothetical protein
MQDAEIIEGKISAWDLVARDLILLALLALSIYINCRDLLGQKFS